MLTVSADEVSEEISATADVLLSLIVQTGVKPSVVEKLSAAEDTLELVTIEPRLSVDPDVIEAQPVPHVGVPALPTKGTPLVPVVAVLSVDPDFTNPVPAVVMTALAACCKVPGKLQVGVVVFKLVQEIAMLPAP